MALRITEAAERSLDCALAFRAQAGSGGQLVDAVLSAFCAEGIRRYPGIAAAGPLTGWLASGAYLELALRQELLADPPQLLEMAGAEALSLDGLFLATFAAHASHVSLIDSLARHL